MGNWRSKWERSKGHWRQGRGRLRAVLPASLQFRVDSALAFGEPSYLWRRMIHVEQKVISERFREEFGRDPVLDGPETFSEKIQWRKLHDRRSIWPRLVDKLRVREFVRKRVGAELLIPLLAVAESPSDLNLEELEPPFILKPNNASGIVLPISSGDHVSRVKRAREAELLGWYCDAPYGLLAVEWAYWEIEYRVIVVEELLRTRKGSLPNDYKFHCFDGEPRYVDVHEGRFSDHFTAHYDADWNKLDLRLGDEDTSQDFHQPVSLDEMLEVAGELSRGLDYVRVDLYDLDGDVYFGEMTVYPASGFRPFDPPGWDRRWGEEWTLPHGKEDRRSPGGRSGRTVSSLRKFELPGLKR